MVVSLVIPLIKSGFLWCNWFWQVLAGVQLKSCTISSRELLQQECSSHLDQALPSMVTAHSSLFRQLLLDMVPNRMLRHTQHNLSSNHLGALHHRAILLSSRYVDIIFILLLVYILRKESGLMRSWYWECIYCSLKFWTMWAIFMRPSMGIMYLEATPTVCC